MTVNEHVTFAMSDHSDLDPFGVRHDDLEIVGAVVALRLMPGSGEADRVAHVRRLLDSSADLEYAISTFTHCVLMHAGRRPAAGDLRDETVALSDALGAFAKHVREMADAYRDVIEAQRRSAPEPGSS